MTMPIDTIEQRLKKLSVKLGLEYEEQDWGIINADGQKLNEFVRLYHEPDLTEKMRYQVFELILASANDALDREIDCQATTTTIERFVDDHSADFPRQVSYWAGLTDDDEFPLAAILRQSKKRE
jgi:hypothetical protein